MTARTTVLSIATLLAVLVLVLPGRIATGSAVRMGSPPSDLAAGGAQITTSLSPAVIVENASPAQQARLDLALSRFAAAGLELPDLAVAFSGDEADCYGHLGWFDPNPTPWHITICSDVDSIVEHELAHAWERVGLTDDVRDAFMEMRGHEVWDDTDVPWQELGKEGVAVIIQQGLGGLPLPAVIGSEPSSRLEAFELLTGRPAPRLVEWMAGLEIACAERPTALSRTVPDRSAERCD